MDNLDVASFSYALLHSHDDPVHHQFRTTLVSNGASNTSPARDHTFFAVEITKDADIADSLGTG